MKKTGWLIPISIIAVHAVALIAKWSSLMELLPAHFDLQGNPSGSMPRSVLPLYPLIGAGVCIVAFLIGYKSHILRQD